MPQYFSLRDVHRAGTDPTYRRASPEVALAMLRVGEGAASADDAMLACCHGFAHDVYEWARRHPRAQAEPIWSGLRRWVERGKPRLARYAGAARRGSQASGEMRPLGTVLEGLQRSAGRQAVPADAQRPAGVDPR